MQDNNQTLRACLRHHLPDSKIIFDDDESYLPAVATWNILSRHHPLAIIQPTTTQEVKSIVVAARHSGARHLAIRGGGHSFEGLSLGGDGAVVIDMLHMNKVWSEPDHDTITAQGGALLGQVHQHAYENGRKMVPMGTCPSVGVAGQIQCGGYGFHSRTYGPFVERAVAFEVVVADGSILCVDKDHHGELFRALRGSGAGSFGVITAVTLQTNDIPPDVANFSVKWKTQDTDVPSVLQATQAACLHSPKFVNAMMMAWLGQFEVFGTILAPSAAVRDETWKDFVSSLPQPDTATIQPTSFIESVMHISKVQTSAPWYQSLDEIRREREEHLRYMKIKSGYIPEPLSHSATDTIGRFLATQPSTGVRVQLLALDPDRMPPSDSTSLPARKCTWLMGMSIFLVVKDQNEQETLRNAEDRLPWLNQAYSLFQPLSAGDYLGDDDLDAGDGDFQETLQKFYGDQLPRLSTTKRTYDPENVFHHALSVPLPRDA